MEKTGLRRSHPALFQNQQAGSDRSPAETQLRLHFHSHFGGVDHENLSPRAARHGRHTGFLPGAASRTYPVLARRVRPCRYLCQRHQHHHLRQQKIFRRNFRVRHPPFALADLKQVESRELMVERSAVIESSSFKKLCDIVAKLRAPGGCPWDREQTHESLLPATIEEAYEVAEAARAKDEAHFREELGDLLLLVVMHAEISREAGKFNIDNVVQEISEKLIRRHPHVFGESDA